MKAKVPNSPETGSVENMPPFPPHTWRSCPEEGRGPQKAGLGLEEQLGIQPHQSISMLLSPFPSPKERVANAS